MSNTNNSKGGGGRQTRGRPKPTTPEKDLNLSSLNPEPLAIPVSPNRFELLSSDDCMCEVCRTDRTGNPNLLLLNCARCKKLFCTLCTDKTQADYNVLSRPDCLWCCPACRPLVEKAFETDMKVENCREYAAELETRIHNLEKEQKQFTDTEKYIKDLIAKEVKKVHNNDTPAPDMKKFITEEMRKQISEVQKEAPPAPDVPDFREIIQEQLDAREAETAERDLQRRAFGTSPPRSQPTASTAQEVITELQEQQKRKNNIILYNIEERHAADEDARVKYDVDSVLELVNYLKDDDDEEFIDEHFNDIKRLGAYDQERSRPLLVEFVSGEEKKNVFNKLNKLKDAPQHLKAVSVCHDMTRSQREADKVLVEQAKNLERQCTENYIFRVRGPPWKRYIKKIQVTQRRNQSENRNRDTTRQTSQSQPERRVHFSGTDQRRQSLGTAAAVAP